MALYLLLIAPGASAQTPDGAAVYARHCARCHETDKTGWSVRKEALAKLPGEAILAQLHLGFMTMVATLTDEEKRAVASYIAGKPVAPFKMPAAPPPQGLCAQTAGAAPPDLLSGPRWNGWGADAENSRFQPGPMAGLTAGQVPRLKLKWAFAFPGAVAAWSQPVIAGGRLFVGSINGAVYSLDARTGCTHWIYQASPTGVRSAVSIGAGVGGARFVAYFGDLEARVHAVDALTGKELWKVKVEDHPFARVTGAVQLVDGRLYVPVASFEEAAAGNPKYECCTFRGSVVALDAGSGKQLWKTHVIEKPPQRTRRTPGGTQLWGPSGAGIWSAPTIDRKRGLLYVATGDHYSDPEEGFGDSVVAMEMASGKIAWGRKLLEGDMWNVACLSGDKVGCPKGEGPDHDFGSSPILRTLAGGRQVLLAGQKSGVLHMLDPDKRGAVIRQIQMGKGGILGGIEWGPASDAERVYVAMSDLDPKNPLAGGGLTAVQIATGEKLWHAPAPKPACLGQPGCSVAQPAAVTTIPGVVFSGSLDGHLRAYASATGALLWDLDTRKPFDTVNRVPGAGGSMNAAGPAVVGGMLFVNSGYGFLGGAPGNVLLAYSVDGR
jgi:polyvinyl alcohol dehydrogenase (cytochrome)